MISLAAPAAGSLFPALSYLFRPLLPSPANLQPAPSHPAPPHPIPTQPISLHDRLNFSSVLAIGYKARDSFSWHTDMAGDNGWVCSISLGASAIFEYLPQVAVSPMERAEALAKIKPISVEVASGDCLLFHGGYLPHRIASCAAEPPPYFAHMARGCNFVRLNLQVRPFGASEKHSFDALEKEHVATY